MRALIFIHRWLGIPYSLLFAMWFATGIVMHFVPFPALTEGERFDGLAMIDFTQVTHGAADAVRASTLKDAMRVRLWQRVDGPVYLTSNDVGMNALHAADLTSASVDSEDLSLAIAVDHARRRGIDVARAMFVETADYDQWTVPNGLDLHRPLYRIALNDAYGTELYVSSTTGEVVRDTTRRERTWNYVGSVVHWIYPTALRKHRPAWDLTVWWLSLFATFVAITGSHIYERLSRAPRVGKLIGRQLSVSNEPMERLGDDFFCRNHERPFTFQASSTSKSCAACASAKHEAPAVSTFLGKARLFMFEVHIN